MVKVGAEVYDEIGSVYEITAIDENNRWIDLVEISPDPGCPWQVDNLNIGVDDDRLVINVMDLIAP